MKSVMEKLEDWRYAISDYIPGRGLGKSLAAAIGVYLLVAVVLGAYWSIAPGLFDVQARAEAYAAREGGVVVTGSVTTVALIGVVETLLEKRGGYLHNDVFPPGVWLDNIPSWEYGALIQARDMSRALREVYSRSQSQSTEDRDLAVAEPHLNFGAKSWILPASESEYGDGLKNLRGYVRRLSDESSPDAQFYARADNLRYWLATVDNRLGSLSQRLSASVGKRRLNTDLAGDDSATQSTDTPSEKVVRTPWTKIDNVFYEARGTAWVLIHFLRAVEVDFAEVLRKKNAAVSVQQIIRELEGTQEIVWSPMILNGTGFGMLANHSLVMASYISRANAAIVDLRDLLSQG